MARNVQIDFTDEIIKINLKNEEIDLRVHKHLLCERSELLEADVESITNGYLDWTGFSCLDLTAASWYLGFLYGRPMWIHDPGMDNGIAWSTLEAIFYLSMKYEDFDAVDACLDGMRELLEHSPSDSCGPFSYTRTDLKTPCGRLMLDYMVHRPFKIRDWIDSYMTGPDDYEMEEALSKKCSKEVKRKKDKIDEPDLKERCRYHLHVEKGRSCYLDK